MPRTATRLTSLAVAQDRFDDVFCGIVDMSESSERTYAACWATLEGVISGTSTFNPAGIGEFR